MTRKKGLIWAYLFDAQGGGRKLDWPDVKNWQSDGETLWVHLDLNVDQAAQWVRSSGHLDEVSTEALLAKETRPRTFATDEGLLVILRGVNLNPNSDPEDMVSLRIWIKNNLIITMRHRRLLAANDITELLEKGHGPRNASQFLTMVADRLVIRMEPVLTSIEEEMDSLETGLGNLRPSEVRQELGDLRHTAIALKRYLVPQRDVMARLQTETHDLIQTTTRQQLREVGDRLIRYIENLEEVRDRAAVLQDEAMNKLSESANRTIYVLTIISAILLPLSFFTGLLGINVGGIPGTENESAFWIVCVLLAGFGVVVALLFRKLKWL